MLADLRALRALQDDQERALRAGDHDRVEGLCAEGAAIIARLAPGPGDGAPDDAAAARDLAPRVLEAQERLEALAAEMRRAILDQLRTLAPGREALAGYRPPARDSSRLLDRSR